MFDKNLFGIAGIKHVFALCMLFSIVTSALVLGQAFCLSSAIVSLWSGATLESQIPEISAFAACFASRSVVAAIQSKVLERFSFAATSHLREALLGRLFDVGRPMSQSFGTAAVVEQLTDGCEDVYRYISTMPSKITSLIAVPLCLALGILAQDLISGIIVIACYPFIVAFMKLIGHTASDESAKRRAGFDAMSNHFLDALGGMETLKSFGVSKRYSQAVFAASEKYRKLIMRTLRIAQLSGAVLDIFATCGLAAVAIMLGFRMVEGSVDFLPALTVLMLVPEYFLPVKSYASDYHSTLNGKTSLSSMLEMLDTRKDTVSCKASLLVPKGSLTLLVGKSGSGKTSILDIVSGISSPGMDGSDGMDIVVAGTPCSSFDVEQWRRRVAYIPQDPSLIAGTIKDNVALYRPDASDENVAKAIEQVGLVRLIESLPHGIYTSIGAGGVRLSGGEAHRIAVARALLDEGRDVWLLDEPGSSLDVFSELDLKDAILPLMQGRTVIVASHRDHWRKDADVVFDIDAIGGVTHG